jgi:hypothetical protein
LTVIAQAGAGGHPFWHYLLAMATPVAMSAAMAARRRWLATTNPVVMVIAVGSVLAGGLHAAVCPDHFREATSFGLFFAGAAVLQAAWAGWVIARPGRAALLAGAVGNLVIAAVWLASRTSGIPIGPQPWHPEAIGALDLFASLVEVVVAGGALMLLHEASSPTRALSRKGVPA